MHKKTVWPSTFPTAIGSVVRLDGGTLTVDKVTDEWVKATYETHSGVYRQTDVYRRRNPEQRRVEAERLAVKQPLRLGIMDDADFYEAIAKSSEPSDLAREIQRKEANAIFLRAHLPVLPEVA